MPGASRNLKKRTKGIGQEQASHYSLLEWATTVISRDDQTLAAHHHLLLHKLDLISRGDIDRLMVLMPPGSAKSTYASMLFPAWWFTQHPVSSVIAASHTRSLAEHFGRQVRELVREYATQLGYSLDSGKQAAGHWQTSGRGEYFATGIRGPMTGHRADLAIIDDPVKSDAEADSPVLRERVWNWYRFELTTRLKPKGRIVLIMTRWHEDDLAGRLLAQNQAEWHVIRLPALAEDGDVLGRGLEDALWPEWESKDALLRKRETMGERAWSALFQQSPHPIVGSLFKVDCVDILDTAPANTAGMTVRAWDLAATAATGGNDPDWTVGVKVTRTEAGRFIVHDVMRLRGTPHGVLDAILEAARIDGKTTIIGLPEDPGQAGKLQVSYFTAALAGYRTSSTRETGSKATRASLVASQVEARNFALVRAGWNYAFLDELRDFPFGRKDDQVDALSRAFTMLTSGNTPARRIPTSFLTR
jgi:predicted phage terminase large subunit-like protein